MASPTRPQDDFAHAVDSWRSDAYDPEVDDFDEQDNTPRKQWPIELLPGVWVYPEFFRKPMDYAVDDRYFDDLGLDDWA